MIPFLLKGLAEAGVFPGIILYISFWYRKREQAMRMAIFFGAAIIAGAASGIFVSICALLFSSY
jgi:MFS family permease